jgi:UDP-GlcNAc3NAcA epimerase
MRARKQSNGQRWVSIVGARPQFVKLAPVCRAIEEHNRRCSARHIAHEIIHTGQHYDPDVTNIFFDQMRIPAPTCNLGVGSGPAGTQFARMLARMEPVLSAQNPDSVIVYGDTNSTLAGALLAARLKLRLVHVEAGCRSADLTQPEEQNRIVADHLSQVLLTVSQRAAENLHREGIGTSDDPFRRRVAAVGDVQYDALLQASKHSQDPCDILQQFDLESKRYYLLTVHRAENTDDPKHLGSILGAVADLDFPVLFPVHPRTREVLAREGFAVNSNVKAVAPQGYLEMLTLESHARKILTDSGGVQKEAFYFGVPCITLRDRTEWLETVELGANWIAGTKPDAIRQAVKSDFQTDWSGATPYGTGNAAERIVSELLSVC